MLRLAYDPDIKRFEHDYDEIYSNSVKVIGEPVGFADDVHFFLDPSDPNNLNILLDTLRSFSDISNLKLNHKKTEFIDINVTPLTIQRVNDYGLAIVDSIKFVGAHTISQDDPSREYALNFAKAKQQSEQYMSRMEHRNISAIGSSIIYNSKVLSKYTHLLYNFRPTDADCEAMNKRAMDFVRSFDGGRYLVKKKRFLSPTPLVA